MARGYGGAVLKAFGARDYTLTVTAVRDITGHFRRITFDAPTFFDGKAIEPTSFVRLWVPDPNHPGKEHQRGYTIVNPDPQGHSFSLEFLLHEPAGPACTWAGRAKPGDTIEMSWWVSPHFEVPNPAPEGYLLIGDAASIPGVNAILDALPDTAPVRVLLEQFHDGDTDIPIVKHPQCTVTWVPTAGPGTLATAIEERDWSNWYGWVTGETAAAKQVRARLKQLGFGKPDIHGRAYWTKGKAMGTNRDQTTPSAPAAQAAVASPPATPAPATPDPALPAPYHSAVSAPPESAAVSVAPPAAAAPAAAAASAAVSPAASAAAPAAAAASAAAASAGVSSVALAGGASVFGKGQWRSRAGAELLAPLKSRLILAGLFQAVVSLLQLAPYLLLAELCRRLLAGKEDFATLGYAALALMGAGVTLAGLLVTAMHVVDARFGYEVRSQVVNKLSRLPLGWFTERSSGRIKKAVQDDATDLHYLVTHAVLDVVAAIVTPLAVLLYLFTVSGWLAAVLLIPLVIFFVLSTRMIQGSAAQLAQFTAWESRVGSEAVAYLDGLAVVRAYDAGPAGGFRATLAERAQFLEAWQRPMSSRKTLMDLVTRPLTSLLLIISVGTMLIGAGALTVANLVPFLLLGVTFGSQLLAAAYGMGAVREAQAAAQRIGLLLAEPELLSTQKPAHLNGQRHTVRFEKVGFSHDGRQNVLQDIDLELSPGTVTALVGPSGAGKSTLAALLARFHDPAQGRITIDGLDLRDLELSNLYNTVGFVFQDLTLIRGSVHENIALAHPDATREQVERAAKAAGIHDRIMRLPNGYDTVGAPLSGGETQRLTIARALLADPPILVLDEATAFADPESEHQVQQALSRLATGRTVLVIAHRLHTITGADAIAVLDGGRIVQRGTHPQLLATPGLYRELWSAAQPQEATL